ncbi:UbiA family prenyltransferase [Kytococcus sedentarius]|uniref:UbiA family prenyltransferase n=1 Tax=Kytococcus sedentarius TaxID=1276 RepID=UPI001950B857|nr:UbiA family prenyltransferase [Kytococcus sedentarius]QRO87337.1 UbiA family prenyltransferase [Kytococcus sedentarius]
MSTSPRSSLRVARALAASCHPLPTVMVTGLGTALAVAAAREVRRGAGATLPASGPGVAARGARLTAWSVAVGSGQLVIGWVNDALDAERDARVGRTDKPVAAGAVSVRTVWGAAGCAALMSALAGRWTGWGLAASQLGLVVVPGVAHSLGAKRTVLSPVPWAVAFGALPVLAHRAGGGVGVPARPAVAGAALGAAAHLVNAARDVEDDALTGQEGLPARLGVAASHGVAAGLVGVAAASVRGPMRWFVGAAAGAVALVGMRAG